MKKFLLALSLLSTLAIPTFADDIDDIISNSSKGTLEHLLVFTIHAYTNGQLNALGRF